MSVETRKWLSENTLIGFTEKRGNAWHYREGDGNHYAGAIPMADVLNRLFNWTPVEEALYIDGGEGMVQVPGRKAIVRSDTGKVMGIFTDGYRMHAYPEWLIGSVGQLLDDDVQIGSAVLLSGGSVAAVQVEVPENFTTPEGVVFRPFLLAATSFDGSIATTYKRAVTKVVCDNTLSFGLGEKGQQIKVRHSRNSLDGKVAAAREALNLLNSTADDFSAEVAKLTATAVSDRAWDSIVGELTKVEDDASKRAVTVAGNRRDALMDLWTTDPRVAPWAGTAYGAVQALNTYRQHLAVVRGASRPERNALNVIQGMAEAEDRDNLRMVLSLAA